MGLYENIKSLCDQHGIAVTRLESELGFARGSIGKLRRQKSMKADRLDKIADFFGVTPTYILTGEHEGYYLNPETAQIAQEMFEDADMRTLYDLKAKMGEERFKAHIELMRKLYAEEHPDE